MGLLTLVALVYWPGLHGGLVFDDYPNIVDNIALRVTWGSSWQEWLTATFSSQSSDLQRPLAMLTFAINHAFTGMDPYWMKLTNVGIHLVNTILVFALVRLTLEATAAKRTWLPGSSDRWIAIWVAAAWALNSINFMAVLFVVQRMESLSHTFVFGGLVLYLMGRLRLRSGRRSWMLILTGLIGGTGLGLMVKESAVLLPVYAFMLEWALLGFSTRQHMADKRLLALFAGVLWLPAALGLAWMIPKVIDVGAYSGRNFDLGERLLTEGRVLVDYIQWTMLPDLSQLSLYHDDYIISRGLLDPPDTLVSLLLLAFLLGATLWLRKRRPLMALGMGWFFSAHLLTATIWPLELVYEHRNYFASLGLCLALADLLLLASKSEFLRRACVLAGLVLVTLYAGTTALRAVEWSNPLRFDLSEASKHPSSPRATYELARSYAILSESDPEYLEKAFDALEHARNVPGASTLPESAAIKLSARIERQIDSRWWTSLQHKLRADPIGSEDITALIALATCTPNKGCQLPSQPMVETFQAALIRERHPEVLNNYASYALKALHDPALALTLWQEAAQRAPTVAAYQENLARMLIFSGKFEQAKAPISRIRELGGLGQNEALALELERLATQARNKRNPESIRPLIP